MNELTLKGGYYYDDNNNRWNAVIETYKSALKKSKSLIKCFNCSDCSCCSYCSRCSDFIINPQRYFTPKIGSRDSITMFYWTNKNNLQIVCGRFKGTLQEFKDKVNTTHKDNELYLNQYLNEIKKIEFLISEN